MKKIFLFLSVAALTLSLNSCSSDSGGGNSVSFKVNGVQKRFKVVAEYSGNQTYVYGYIGDPDNVTEVVEFNMQVGETTNPIQGFSYHDNESNDNGSANVTSNATSNTSSEAKGTFSGSITPFNGTADIIISDGKFSVKPQFVD